jgi:hypothetical protein
MVSWTTRATGESNPRRYISANADQSKFSIKDVLYGADYCKHTVIVFEGPVDVWKIGPGATALIGLQYSRAQLMQIARFPKRYICLDSTPDAQKVAMKLCTDLMMFSGKTYNIKLDAKDAGEASDKEVEKLKALLG